MTAKTAVAAALEESRPSGAETWELPPWGHTLGLGVYPLLIRLDSFAIPIGTAFCISKLGVLGTAVHNIREAFRYSPRGEALLRKRDLEGHLDLGKVSLAVLHNLLQESGRLRLTVWPLVRAEGAPPSDLLFAQAALPTSSPFLPLPVSFAVPRIGSKVRCLGYCETAIDDEEGRLSIAKLEGGQIGTWETYYRHRLKVVEGRVTGIFLQGFAQSFASGACFSIDAPVDHGMSGGPVFNEAGFVCGMVCSSGIVGERASLVSLWYPAFFTAMPFGCQFGDGKFRFNFRQPMMALIDRNAIVTDGSEELVHFRSEEGKWRIGPLIHEDDWHHVFDDGYGFEGQVPAGPDRQGAYRVRRRDRPISPAPEDDSSAEE